MLTEFNDEPVDLGESLSIVVTLQVFVDEPRLLSDVLQIRPCDPRKYAVYVVEFPTHRFQVKAEYLEEESEIGRFEVDEFQEYLYPGLIEIFRILYLGIFHLKELVVELELRECDLRSGLGEEFDDFIVRRLLIELQKSSCDCELFAIESGDRPEIGPYVEIFRLIEVGLQIIEPDHLIGRVLINGEDGMLILRIESHRDLADQVIDEGCEILFELGRFLVKSERGGALEDILNLLDDEFRIDVDDPRIPIVCRAGISLRISGRARYGNALRNQRRVLLGFRWDFGCHFRFLGSICHPRRSGDGIGEILRVKRAVSDSFLLESGSHLYFGLSIVFLFLPV